MKHRVGPKAWWLVLALLGLLVGCVERRFVITSDPPGAMVFDEKGQPMGMTPVDRSFIYYGTYKFTLVHDGCQTHVAKEPIRAPWFEWLPFDFISENLLPWNIRDVRRLHYSLPPTPMVPAKTVLDSAQQLRARGQEITPVGQPQGPDAILPPAGQPPSPN